MNKLTVEPATKISRLVEAEEDFINAIIDGRWIEPDEAAPGEIDEAIGKITSSRTALANVLTEFLQPTLRVIHGGKQAYGANWPERDKPYCRKCKKTEKCADTNCPDWHAAIRRALGQKVDDRPSPDSPQAA